MTAQPGSMPTYLGMPAFPDAARKAVADSQLRRNLTHATTAIRVKRAGAVAELDDWKHSVRRRRDQGPYARPPGHVLLRLEANVTNAGGSVISHATLLKRTGR